MIRTDDPDGPIRLQNAPALRQPSAAERVVGCEILKFVPRIVDAVDARVVGPQQIARELPAYFRVNA
jgi:hypothetical protein